MAHKAPGKHYREGISLVEVIRRFPDDAAAERWFTEMRWPDGAHCPHCGSVNVQDGTKHKTMPYRCRDCRKWFSVKTGTVMQSSKLARTSQTLERDCDCRWGFCVWFGDGRDCGRVAGSRRASAPALWRVDCLVLCLCCCWDGFG